MKSTTDVWFIAFLMNNGYKISKYDVINRGKVKCFFDIEDDEWKKVKLDFNQSDIIKFKGLIEQIKDLAY
jgi:uncharacterized protein YicC (UPF0701 family)